MAMTRAQLRLAAIIAQCKAAKDKPPVTLNYYEDSNCG